ncbi:hypothetical protein [Magnetofaba australis]|uniref:hypothetical protein n=1 Tax=Magnetofaba australis TaxID=1472297 RepID=UPI00117EF93E|nr:hypothetical protein [Magnetofaba australis]
MKRFQVGGLGVVLIFAMGVGGAMADNFVVAGMSTANRWQTSVPCEKVRCPASHKYLWRYVSFGNRKTCSSGAASLCSSLNGSDYGKTHIVYTLSPGQKCRQMNLPFLGLIQSPMARYDICSEKIR